MKYRPLNANGDYTVGVPFLNNTPACVAQAVLTRLKLWQGEWFVDVTDGTPYLQQVLGERPGKNPDAAIKSRILGTPGVTAINSYSSNYNGATRTFAVTANLQTQYGPVQIALPSIAVPTFVSLSAFLAGSGVLAGSGSTAGSD